jgi:hypothetical protein
MATTFAITNKVHERLKNLANQHNISIEALGNVLLILALNDDDMVKRAVNLIKNWDLNKGAERLEKEHEM